MEPEKKGRGMLSAEEVTVAREMIAKLVALAREKGDDEKLAMALHAQGHSLVMAGELEAGLRCFDECREVSLRLGDKRGAAISLSMIGLLALVAGELEQGLPTIVSAWLDLEEADLARARIALYLGEKAKAFDAKRFDAALKAATRGKPPLVHEELAKAVEAARSGAAPA